MNYSDNKQPEGIIFTDFDGTLFNSERFITEKNLEMLKTARGEGYITAIATGRSLFSFRRVAARLSCPVEEYFDYLVFSSGAGTIKCLEGIRGFDSVITKADLLEAENLPPPAAFEAAGILFRQGIDFMIHRSVPENHKFVHIKSNGAVNPDYYRRIKIYSDFAESIESSEDDSELDIIEKICFEGVSQLLAVVPPAGNTDYEKYISELVEYLRQKLPGCTIIRTTSPIDHNSLWIEFFNPSVSKAKTAARLTERLGLTVSDALAVGNDFNDEDLLHWAGTARTVDEAPEPLKKQFPSAGRAIDSAVATAISDFMARRTSAPA